MEEREDGCNIYLISESGDHYIAHEEVVSGGLGNTPETNELRQEGELSLSREILQEMHHDWFDGTGRGQLLVTLLKEAVRPENLYAHLTTTEHVLGYSLGSISAAVSHALAQWDEAGSAAEEVIRWCIGNVLASAELLDGHRDLPSVQCGVLVKQFATYHAAALGLTDQPPCFPDWGDQLHGAALKFATGHGLIDPGSHRQKHPRESPARWLPDSQAARSKVESVFREAALAKKRLSGAFRLVLRSWEGAVAYERLLTSSYLKPKAFLDELGPTKAVPAGGLVRLAAEMYKDAVDVGEAHRYAGRGADDERIRGLIKDTNDVVARTCTGLGEAALHLVPPGSPEARQVSDKSWAAGRSLAGGDLVAPDTRRKARPERAATVTESSGIDTMNRALELLIGGGRVCFGVSSRPFALHLSVGTRLPDRVAQACSGTGTLSYSSVTRRRAGTEVGLRGRSMVTGHGATLTFRGRVAVGDRDKVRQAILALPRGRGLTVAFGPPEPTTPPK